MASRWRFEQRSSLLRAWEPCGMGWVTDDPDHPGTNLQKVLETHLFRSGWRIVGIAPGMIEIKGDNGDLRRFVKDP